MKRKIHVFVLVLSVFFSTQAYGQTSSPIDLVLLLDTSAGMSSSYDNVNNYISGAFLNEYLRVGDTFHLISFSSSPRLDAARRISGIGDVETIIGRMFIQYPVERDSNVGAAISYAEQYIISLPNRPKKVVLVSTGGSDTNNLVTSVKSRLSSRNTTFDYIQVTPGQALSNLPKSGRSPAASTTAASSSASVPSASTSSASASRTAAATVQSGGSGTTASADTRTQSTAAGRTDTSNNASGQTGSSSSAAVSGTSGTSSAPGTGTSGTAAGSTGPSSGSGTDTSGTSASGTGSALGTNSRQDTSPPEQTTGSSGAANAGITSESSASASGSPSPVGNTTENSEKTDSKRSSSGGTASPSSANSRDKTGSDLITSLPLIIGVIIGILLLLGLILLLSSRKLGSRPNRVMEEAASSRPSGAGMAGKEEKFADHSKDLNSFATAGSARRSTPYEDRSLKDAAPVINPSGPLLLKLFVEDQNTSTGKRNIHSLKSGYSFSLGGGKSDDYLIFLVPMPPAIGEIRRDGSTLTFTPKKAKYFPDIGSSPVRDCINKTIRVVSDKNYEMRFRFEMYEDPLIALNRVLMQVKVPGM